MTLNTILMRSVRVARCAPRTKLSYQTVLTEGAPGRTGMMMCSGSRTPQKPSSSAAFTERASGSMPPQRS